MFQLEITFTYMDHLAAASTDTLVSEALQRNAESETASQSMFYSSSFFFCFPLLLTNSILLACLLSLRRDPLTR